MSLRPDHKALVFIGAIGVLGAGVRVMRAATGEPAVVNQPALEHQLAAADSSRKQQGRGKSGSKQRGAGRRGRGSTPADPSPVRGKLDVDVATAAQLDSLPGITPTLAKRIVADRITRGPFMSRDGLRRVSGVGPMLIQQLDTLITFTGTFAPSSPRDTVIVPRKKSRGKRTMPPVARRRSAPRRVPSLRAVADSCSQVPVSSASRRRAT